MQAIVLASSSPYRARLLERLGLPLRCVSPDIDESLLPGESAPETAVRLARLKAERVAAHCVDSVVIGSDQVPCRESGYAGSVVSRSPGAQTDNDALDAFSHTPLGKPGTLENARSQLRHLSGKRVHFHTALCLIDTASGRRFSACEDTVVSMRHLHPDEIERYLQQESVLDCAGSFKVEGLGISLFESVDSCDPTALVGLPLISVCRGLRQLGVAVP